MIKDIGGQLKVDMILRMGTTDVMMSLAWQKMNPNLAFRDSWQLCRRQAVWYVIFHSPSYIIKAEAGTVAGISIPKSTAAISALPSLGFCDMGEQDNLPRPPNAQLFQLLIDEQTVDSSHISLLTGSVGQWFWPGVNPASAGPHGDCNTVSIFGLFSEISTLKIISLPLSCLRDASICMLTMHMGRATF